jgi:hypothetical protein
MRKRVESNFYTEIRMRNLPMKIDAARLWITLWAKWAKSF